MSRKPPPTLLEGLHLLLLRMRLTLRLLHDAALPEHKGAMLRGGFGYALQRASCPDSCWGRSHNCTSADLCAYRWIFETPRPPGVERLHDLRDVPRPFVIMPPVDGRTRYEAGETLEFGLTLIGRGIEYLPYFLYGFEQLGMMGLGRNRARARLERVEVLPAWEVQGTVIYQDGGVLNSAAVLPEITPAMVYRRAAHLPADLRLTLRTPLRLKTRGAFLTTIDVPVLIQAICWRLSALAAVHGAMPWDVDHQRLIEAARPIRVEQAQIRWVEMLRTSTRGGTLQTMPQGGMVGSVVLRDVTEEVRALLLLGSLVHLGKACTFGHGGYRVEGITRSGD
ncbi:MAG: CRISPR system precrRNA processing endoribonuclease RAMP protein Cas6 [Roseiflexus sp.]